MKNTQKILSVIAALTLAVSLPAEIMTTSTAAAVSQKSGDREQLTITDEAGLIKFAKACSIDSYSKNLYVTLGSDIELSGEFTPIPVFGGVFDGAGPHYLRAEYNFQRLLLRTFPVCTARRARQGPHRKGDRIPRGQR